MYVELEGAAERPAARPAIESECIVTDTPRNIRHEEPTKHQKSTSPTDPHQPTYFRVSKEHLAIDTLLDYNVPYELDGVNNDYINILREIEPAETEVWFAHTRHLRSHLLIEERCEEDFDVMNYIQKTREARKVLQSVSVDHGAALESKHKHKLSTRSLFERSPSPPPAPTPGLRRRSSTLSLRGKRRDYESKALKKATKKVISKLLVEDHCKTSPEQPVNKDSERKETESDDNSVAVGSAELLQQPKSLQSPFVRKLHAMLVDQSIQHLISWSSTNDSFVLSPSSEFSKKVLASYFRHTDIASFVRQLNMYGFYKVDDVSKYDSPDSQLWEFKHGHGMFQRGDLEGLLQETKRPPSRFAPMHVDPKHFKEYCVDGADPHAALVHGSAYSYELKENPYSRIEGSEYESRKNRQEASLPEHYALPELEDLIAGWQTKLSFRHQTERDSGFHEGEMVRLSRTPDLVTYELDHESMLKDSDALVPGPERAPDVQSTRSSRTYPINDPKLLATVENVIKKIIPPKLIALKKDQDTQRNRSGFDDIIQLASESRNPTMKPPHSTVGQIIGASIPWDDRNQESSGSAPVPDHTEERTAPPSLGEQTSSNGSKVGMMDIGGSHDSSFRFDYVLRAPSLSNTDENRESLLSSQGGSEYASNTSTPHCDVDVQKALDSAMNVVKGLMLQKLVGHALSEAMDATGSSVTSSRGSGGANAVFPSPSSQKTTRNNGGKRARGGGRDPDDDGGDDSDEDDNNRPKKKDSAHRAPQRRLKCPFYQRQPEKYTKAACRGEGFTEMGKLKDHLKRVHMHPLRCCRCHLEMMSEEELRAHMLMDIVCEKRLAPVDDRIAPETLSKLDFKRAPFVNARSTGEKWKILYKRLFPTDLEADIPSPYDRNTLSTDFARVLSEALEEAISEELAPYMEPIITRVKALIPAIIERCRRNLATPVVKIHEDTNIRTPLPDSVKGACSASESNSPVRCLNISPGAFLRPDVTVSEVKRKQPQFSSVPQMTPSGSSEASEERSMESVSAHGDNIARIENLGNMQGSEPSANVTELGHWNKYEPAPVPIFLGSDTDILDFSLPETCQGDEEQVPGSRPLHNDPIIYGGSVFGVNDMQDWSSLATPDEKGLDANTPTWEQLFHEERLSPQATDWQVTERDQSRRASAEDDLDRMESGSEFH